MLRAQPLSPPSPSRCATSEPAPPAKRSPAHYLWAVLSPRAHRSGGFLSTSGSARSPHTYPRRADHRCGMTAMRRRMTGCTLSPIGIWRHNRPPRRQGRSAPQLVTGQNGDKDSPPASGAPDIPGAPPSPHVKSACWRWIGQAPPYCGRGEGFYEC